MSLIVPDNLQDGCLATPEALPLFDHHPAGVLVYFGNASASQAAALAANGVDVAVLDAQADVETLRLRIADYLPGDLAFRFRWTPPTELDFTRALTVRPMQVAHVEGPQKEVLEWRWYADGGLNALMDKEPVLDTLITRREDVYTRVGDPDYGVPVQRVETIHWIRADGTDHPVTKSRKKDYDAGIGQAAEGEKRRTRKYQEVLGKVGAGLVALGQDYTQGIALAQTLGNEVSTYINYNDPTMVHSIAGSSAPWLSLQMPGRGVTFRQYMTTNLWVFPGTPPAGS